MYSYSDVQLILKGVVKHGIYGKSVITGYILSWVISVIDREWRASFSWIWHQFSYVSSVCFIHTGGCFVFVAKAGRIQCVKDEAEKEPITLKESALGTDWPFLRDI